MRSTMISDEDGIRLDAVAPRAMRQRRIDLVVTDYDFPNTRSCLGNADRLQPELRCSIPLAVLIDNISGDALNEVAHFHWPSTREPINSSELLRLLETIFAALRDASTVPDFGPDPDPADASRIARLTSRETQVLEHIVAGDPNKTTALKLGISRRTVEHHRAAIMHKTRTRSVPELVRLALRAHPSVQPQLSCHD